jgi:cobalt-zinc-cadmium efflux system outer membrane protein
MFNGCVTNHKEIATSTTTIHRVNNDTNVHSTHQNKHYKKIDALLRKNGITINDLLMIARLNNPTLAQMHQLIEMAHGQLEQAQVYPNPILGLSFEDMPADDFDFNRSTNKISITQPIIIGNKRTAAISASKVNIDARSLALISKSREIVGEIYEIYVEIIYQKQAHLLYNKLLVLANQTLSTATIRFEARAVLEAEVIKAQIEVHTLTLGKDRLHHQRIAMIEKLQATLGNKEITFDQIVGELSTDTADINLDDLKSQVKKNHPTILAAKKEVKSLGYRVEQAQAERLSDVNLTVAFGRDEAINENIVEAQIGIPLPIFDTNKGNIHVAQSLHRRAMHHERSITGRLLATLASEYALYMTAKREVEMLKNKVVPAAQKSLEQIQSAYSAGRMDLLDLLDAQRTYANAQLSLLASIKKLNIAKARISKITGHPEGQFNE